MPCKRRVPRLVFGTPMKDLERPLSESLDNSVYNSQPDGPIVWPAIKQLYLCFANIIILVIFFKKKLTCIYKSTL